MQGRRRSRLGLSAIVLLVLWLGGVRLTAAVYTERVLSREEFVASIRSVTPMVPFCAGRAYAVVDEAALAELLAGFRMSLSRSGLGVAANGRGSWDTRFNCYALAWGYITQASIELAREKWHSYSAATRPAMVAVSYRPDAPAAAGEQNVAHTVVLVVTERGPVFIDPQLGEVALSAHELATVFYPQA